ncbi:hypothetical protein GMOD_00003831 [Pyrenophora seminiperda CCB06]|uniref:Uncharacterized protein n=1 Tax=Pyrenophora seminiperda CCB06 TaxID=1302712 RepID=A0A3M7LZW8_9PLEO|nr:hypothetical protein GMOD_00003831 [Pyrenophora seminiperda CCB06]
MQVQKSPKKKILETFRGLFKKTSAIPVPPMPQKAAEVIGITPRQHRVIRSRPIISARVESPTAKPFRSGTSKSLPVRKRAHSPRRNRPSRRASPSRDGPISQRGDIEKTPGPKVGVLFDLSIPPTPPAKDTPPEFRVPSPLHRSKSDPDLHETYEIHEASLREDVNPRLPPFNLTLLPTPQTSIRDELPERTSSLSKPEGKRVLLLPGSKLETLQLSAPNGEHSSLLLGPHFYSPMDRPACGFAEGESPSKNSDHTRLLYTVPGKSAANLHQAASLHQVSRDGTINMMYQGTASDIDPNSPTGRELKHNQTRAKASEGRPDTEITSRVMQELRIGEKHRSAPQMSPQPGHFQLDHSSSRLNDMLNNVSPDRSETRSETQSESQPLSLSAMPSPLHNVSGHIMPMRPHTMPHGTFGASPRNMPKTVEDHFFMTNEHLDVVGKTTWDLLEGIHKYDKGKSKAKQEQLLVHIDKRTAQIKSHMDAQISKTNEEAARAIDDCAKRIQERTDRVVDIADNQHKAYATLSSVSESVKETIPNALAEQDKKMASMQAELSDMKQLLQGMQKMLEQKQTEAKAVQQHGAAPDQSHTLNRVSSLGIASYTGAASEAGNMHENRGMIPPQDNQMDPRLGYQWSARSGFPSRNGKEDRPYPTNPYHAPNGGHYNSPYAGGYSSYNYNPSPPDQNFPFNGQGPGQAK